MRITKFKSLYTNTDPNDIKLEYLSVARNARLRDKATETKFYDSNNIEIPDGITKVLAYETIELDNDKLQSDTVDNKIIPTKDHIIPRSKGGYNIKENIIPACRCCNAKKHNKTLDNNNLPNSLFRSWFFN